MKKNNENKIKYELMELMASESVASSFTYCHYQGYFTSKPVPIETFKKLLN